MAIYWTRSVLDRKMELRIVGGQNRLSKRPKPVYTLRKDSSAGVVKVDGKRFYYFGFAHNAAGERNVGKAAAGAIVGGLLTGGIGALLGGALGGRKKNTSTATLVFADFDSDSGQVPFEVVVACDDYLRDQLAKIPVCVYNEAKGTIWRP